MLNLNLFRCIIQFRCHLGHLIIIMNDTYIYISYCLLERIDYSSFHKWRVKFSTQKPDESKIYLVYRSGEDQQIKI